MSNDILRIVLCRGLVRGVVSVPKESLGKLVTDFVKTLKLLILEGTFDISEVSLCFWVCDHFGYFEKHSCSVHFCLMNL